jgi:hypothetical protein
LGYFEKRQRREQQIKRNQNWRSSRRYCKQTRCLNAKAIKHQVREDTAEGRAKHYLQGKGLQLLQRNYRTSYRVGEEINVVIQESDETLVLKNVRICAREPDGG